jgi:hypothetical protein
MVWLKRDGVLVRLAGLPEPAERLKRHAQVRVEVGDDGVGLDRASDQRGRDLVLPDLVGDDAEEMEGVGLIRLVLQNAPVRLLGLREVARLVVLDRD